jgi:succinate dehydrogenase / fumarate reductase flavoprotein subunit
MAAIPRIIVVGGGLAGLSAIIKIAEAGGKTTQPVEVR